MSRFIDFVDKWIKSHPKEAARGMRPSRAGWRRAIRKYRRLRAKALNREGMVAMPEHVIPPLATIPPASGSSPRTSIKKHRRPRYKIRMRLQRRVMEAG